MRTRVLLLTLLVFVALSVPAYFAFGWMVDRTIARLGTLFAEKQVLYDRYRGMETLSREVSLAATLTRSPVIREWAADESDPAKKARGLAELEHYRLAFADQSVFFVVNDSGNYYFNDRENSYGGAELRYTIDRNNPRDGWYYTTIANGGDCQLNVDHDDIIQVTKVWINCPIVDRGRVLGMIGSGIDLSDFIRDVVAVTQPGVDSMFVDRSGAIQANQNPELVDYHSLTKDTAAKKTVFSLLDRPDDRTALADMMESAASADGAVSVGFVTIGGQKWLAGVGYLGNLGWFNVTLMDLDRIIERRLFAPIAALFGAILLIAALLVTVLFKRAVLDRLARLETAVRSVQAGKFAITATDTGGDEIGRLSRAFASMAASIGDNTQLLEALVKERTVKLEHLAEIDPLTEIFNRRGFMHAVERERNRSGRHHANLGLLLVDVDLLKKVNDSFGHAAGDFVLCETARRMRGALRNYDVLARWGGDEFAILVSDCDADTLAAMSKKIRRAISGHPLTLSDGTKIDASISVGGGLVAADESFDTLVRKADAALYAAKNSGRNHIVIDDPTGDQERSRLEAS